MPLLLVFLCTLSACLLWISKLGVFSDWARWSRCDGWGVSPPCVAPSLVGVKRCEVSRCCVCAPDGEPVIKNNLLVHLLLFSRSIISAEFRWDTQTHRILRMPYRTENAFRFCPSFRYAASRLSHQF